jgi:hypothetical protein
MKKKFKEKVEEILYKAKKLAPEEKYRKRNQS